MYKALLSYLTTQMTEYPYVHTAIQANPAIFRWSVEAMPTSNYL